MKSIFTIAIITVLLVSCADNELEVKPLNANFPFQLVLDAEEGGDLPDAEDYGLEIKFADFLGELPEQTVTIDYKLSDLTDDMVGAVEIDEVIAEVEDDEVALNFTQSPDKLSGTITLNIPATGELPESLEVVFKLPGEEDTFFAAGGFKFTISNLRAGGANMVLGYPDEFEYEVLDHELAGSWKYEITNQGELDDFQDVFGPINADLAQLSFADVKVGEVIEVEYEFEYEEMKIVIVYLNSDDEEVEIEIEADYDFDDGELELEGSYLVFGDDGEVEDELDFIVEAEFEITGSDLTISYFKVIDEDNFDDGEELFFRESGVSFTLEKD
ncbi:MAG TPA: hypothetical protein DCE81_03980 [Cytophagales bacterium]|nr:hypothetical protein [Cytophagales bacterium]